MHVQPLLIQGRSCVFNSASYYLDLSTWTDIAEQKCAEGFFPLSVVNASFVGLLGHLPPWVLSVLMGILIFFDLLFFSPFILIWKMVATQVLSLILCLFDREEKRSRMSHWLLPTRNKPSPPPPAEAAARRLRRAYAAAALGWQLVGPGNTIPFQVWKGGRWWGTLRSAASFPFKGHT